MTKNINKISIVHISHCYLYSDTEKKIPCNNRHDNNSSENYYVRGTI